MHKIQKLAGFAKIGTDGERGAEGVERRVVDEAVERIAEKLQLLGCGRDLVVPRIEENSDVGGLSRTVFEDIPEAKDRVGMLRNTLAKFGAGMLVRNVRACCFERLGVRDSISGLLTTEREAIGGLQEYDPHSWYVIVFEQI